MEKIIALANEQRPRQARKLKGAERAYRLRVRVYRIVYSIDDEKKMITVTSIRHRREVYR